MKLSKTIWTMAMVIGWLSFFSTCSGTLGGAYGSVRIAIPGVGNASSGRFVDAATMTSGYVILGRGDQVYSLNEYTQTHELIKGEVVLSNIEAGTYLLGVVLKNKKDIVTGLALKNITVTPGYNEVEVVVGPGISKLEIEGVEGFEANPFDTRNDAYSLSFSEDTMIFDYGRQSKAAIVSYYPTFGTGSSRRITKIEASIIDADGAVNSSATVTGNKVTVTVSAGASGVRFTLTDNENDTYIYKVILK